MNKPPKTAAALTSAGLSLLFIAVYGGSNWLAAQRTDVGTWYYEWERIIPFVPIFIIPYMSIDLFFVAGPFLCDSRNELQALAKRIGVAILIAGAFFVLMPLQLAVERPKPEGWTAAIFSFLHGFDQPHNLFPSLHIALRTILADLYARHTKGALRFASNVWFSLIGLSTLLTYQHHFADVAGGFVLGALCLSLFPREEHRSPLVPNYRVGAYYALGAILLGLCAIARWPRTAFLLWPAAVLAVTAAAYWRLGPSIYRKRNGLLPSITRLLFAPTLLCQYLSLWHYRRNCDAWNAITPRVWIGARLNAREALAAKGSGLTAVLDLTAEFSEASTLLDLRYHNVPVLDLTAPTTEQLLEAVSFIAECEKRGPVCVHCKIGYSRSAAAVGAYLLATGTAGTVEEALSLIRAARPSLIVRPEVKVALEQFRGQIMLSGGGVPLLSSLSR